MYYGLQPGIKLSYVILSYFIVIAIIIIINIIIIVIINIIIIISVYWELCTGQMCY